jgi:hypothetical protein
MQGAYRTFSFTLTPSTGTNTVALGSAGTGATVPITIDAKGSAASLLLMRLYKSFTT